MINHKYLPLLVAIFLFACSGGGTENQDAATVETKEEVAESKSPEVTGFESLDDLTASFLQAVSARDYESYLSHVITTDIENELAGQIEREDMRSDFIKEFGFSLKNEKEYFDNITKYLDEKGLDPMSAAHDQLEIIDYRHDHYSPLEIKEIIIPFPYEDYEIDLIVIAVNYNGNWLLTSEIGL